jgi:SPP1 gp7 family putative phage head morphogenesis protein
MNPKLQTLKPIRANLGIETQYRRYLREWIELMHKSIMRFVVAAYRRNEPILAQDASPAIEIQKAIRKLIRRWKRNFNEAAPKLAKWFATAAWKRSDKALQKILKDAGFSVKFTMTKAQRDVLHATINQNVSLIRSIPSQYLTQVEGVVMRSVQTGRDLATLTTQLQKQFGVTKKRAAFIALDQNQKATSALTRARQLELGITKAVWQHSHAGKQPRQTHVAMNGKVFDVVKGMYDSHEKTWVHPGELIRCRCFSRSIIKGFSI